MRERGEGEIINCSSIAGLVGTQGGAIYCAGKHGVIGINRAAALDLTREKIRVNAICPGAIDTAMVRRAVGARPEVREMIAEMQPIGRIGDIGRDRGSDTLGLSTRSRTGHWYRATAGW